MDELKKYSQRYSEYLKNNPEGYWFKRKLYGWGWTPVKWQGWLTLIVYIILIMMIAYLREPSIADNPNSGSNFLTFALPLLVLTGILIYICYKKGESPRWQWGLPKDQIEEKETEPLP